MQYRGVLTKMQTEFSSPINYFLVFESEFIHINQLLEKQITLSYDGEECLSCHLQKDIFRQGFCRSCFYEKPIAGDWIMRPELSTAHLDIEDRDLDYEKKVQLQPHIVYLANSSNVKVGVTRKSQVPTRWIDQGAHEAVEILEVPNRYLAGVAEVALKEHISDKTNWRNMLKNNNVDEDLNEHSQNLIPFLPNEVKPYVLENQKETNINFPVLQYPEKPKSLNLKKEGQFLGKLVGVKGQYLIFEDQTVFNVRSNEGMIVKIEL